MPKGIMKLLSLRSAAAQETPHERSTASQRQASWHDMPPHKEIDSESAVSDEVKPYHVRGLNPKQ